MLIQVTNSDNLKVIVNTNTLMSIDELQSGEACIYHTETCFFMPLESYQDIVNTINSNPCCEPIWTIQSTQENKE